MRPFDDEGHPLSASAVPLRLPSSSGGSAGPVRQAGLDWAYWQITDGNDEIATDGRAAGRGGTLAGTGGGRVRLDWLDPEPHATSTRRWASTTLAGVSVSYADISGLWMSDRLHVGDTSWSLGIMFQF
jgi:hypothetical protein